MGKSFAMKILSAVAVGVVLLGHVYPVAEGMLMCIGDGLDLDCCGKPISAHESHVDEAKQFVDGSDCSCCIAVDAVPCTGGASSRKVALEDVSGPVLLCSVASCTGTRIPRARSRNAGATRLGSSRTVVLLI